ncbi:MAG TPA: lipid IV(A) 3-deoxy-D-manno-octulosonic acid transferase [Burkholderiaceae bacterium]|nr:lipid IV(A) 3-deoxy-D-manno-octulosonic acid transferase [Burkholderiaceae bacterium]
MPRFAYTVLVWLVMPLAALYLLWRSRRQPAYRAHWGERFGWARYTVPRDRHVIWIHAVSVGETRAAEPLISALAQRFPQHGFLLTHMTPTGRATGVELAARWPGRVTQAYLPYDMPFAVRRLLRTYAPVVGLGMETETWPNLLAEARAAQLPMVLVNARLSERSFAKAQKLPRLMREAAQSFATVLAQTEADAERMRAVGARQVVVIGNLKFDFTPDPSLVERGRAFRAAVGSRTVLLFATTREGEEAMLLDALAGDADPSLREALVIIVPRHPQRFDDVARLIEARGRPVLRRSAVADWSAAAGSTDAVTVLLGDSMGEMAMYYASASVAFVGGSLLPLGGHNLIEACGVGVPVVVGPHTFNFAQATDDAIGAGAEVRVGNAAAAVEAMRQIAGDAEGRARMSEAALHFARQHRGATDRALAHIVPLVEARTNSR